MIFMTGMDPLVTNHDINSLSKSVLFQEFMYVCVVVDFVKLLFSDLFMKPNHFYSFQLTSPASFKLPCKHTPRRAFKRHRVTG